MSRSTLHPGSVDQWVQQAKQLYSLPAVALRVLELTADPNADAAALKSCIEKDPALSARLLRVVNSSVFGFPGQIADLGRAVALLGARPLRMLVLGFSLPRRLLEEIDAKGLARFWRRALVRAVAAREICREKRLEGGDEAFVAGLLHDMGELVFWKECGPNYARLVARADESGEPRAKWEQATLGCGAAELTARLLAQWQLPAALVEAIGAAAGGAQASPLPPWTVALQMADRLAWLIDSERPRPWRPTDEWGAWSDAELCDWVAMVERQVEQLAAGMQVALPPGRDYRDILAAAQARLAELHEAELSTGAGGAGSVESGVAEGGAGDAASERPGATAPAAPADQATAVAACESGAASEAGTAVATAIGMAVARCRAARQPLSLLLLRIRPPGELAILLGRERAERYARFVAACLRGREDSQTQLLVLDEQHLALLLRGQDRLAACALGRELLGTLATWPRTAGESCGATASLVLGAGVATLERPPPAFPPNELFAAAERCLFAAGRSGGGLKSIEL